MQPRQQSLTAEPDVNLSYLNIVRLNAPRSQALRGMRITIIGGGPTGLTLACALASQGAEAIVLEKAADPRGKDAGYTNRSFNITLNEVGRYVLGDDQFWRGGNLLTGRAVHDTETHAVRYARYGDSPDADLVSVPRPILRQNMATLAEAAGVQLRFHTSVSRIDADKGAVTYTDQAGEDHLLSADLVVACDGMHGLSDTLLADRGVPPAYCSAEPRTTITALMGVKDHDLSLHHIHFWHAPATDSYSIAIPNADGTMGILLATPYDEASGAPHPYASSDNTKQRLKTDFPELYELDPKLADVLPLQPRPRFPYKVVSDFILGQRGVIVGDAGYVFPPWAGFGANNAMYSAASLAWLLAAHRTNLSKAMSIYNAQQKVLARLIMHEVSVQSEFFNGHVIDNPEARSDSQCLGPLIRQAYARSDHYLDKLNQSVFGGRENTAIAHPMTTAKTSFRTRGTACCSHSHAHTNGRCSGLFAPHFPGLLYICCSANPL